MTFKHVIPRMTCSVTMQLPALKMQLAEISKVFVVFPVHNRLDATKEFLQSLVKQTYRNFQVVICDDGSTDGTATYIRTHYPEVVLIEGDGELWWTAGMNKCVQYVLKIAKTNDYVLTINNDVTLDENYLAQKVERGLQYPGAIIGSICLFKDHPQLIETSGLICDKEKSSITSLTKFGEPLSQKHFGVKVITHVCGKGVLIPVDVFKKVGLYDATNFPQYHADSDFTLRAHYAGLKILMDFDSKVYSVVNWSNLGLRGNRYSLMVFSHTFQGTHSLNNLRIRWRFAKKHFPENPCLYLLKTEFGSIGGFIYRYGTQIWKDIFWIR